MAAVAKSVACLRISGDALVPAEVTRLLGAEPDIAYRKGDVAVFPGGGRRIRSTGLWLLRTRDRTPADLEAQVQDLLGVLQTDLATWATLSSSLDVELFCGLFLEESNEGAGLSRATVAALSARFIEVSFDIYGPEAIQPSNTDDT